MGVYDTAKEIADNFEISKSLVCRSVDSLTKKGYIDTQKDEKDKRVSHLILREEAKPIVEALKENRKKTTEDLLLGIDKEELKIFSKVLNQMKNNMI